MNNIAREKLCQIINRFGTSLCDDPQRCKGILRDLCGDCKLEIRLLITALKENVHGTLLSSQKGMPRELILSQLVKCLIDNLGLKEDAARWAVESWAVALGVVSLKDIQETSVKSKDNDNDLVGEDSHSKDGDDDWATESIPASKVPLEKGHKKRVFWGVATALLVVTAVFLTSYKYYFSSPPTVDSSSSHTQKVPPIQEKPVESGPEGLTKMPPEPVKTRFTKAKDGVISDSATGLEWYVGPDRDTSWNQAKSWTENLTAAGGGWRMPTVPELKSLFQEGTGLNNMDPIFQPTNYFVWSGQVRDASSAWAFAFFIGRKFYNYLDFAVTVRAFAVRSRR